MGFRANPDQESIGIKHIKYYFLQQICWQCDIGFGEVHNTNEEYEDIKYLTQASS